MFYERFSCIFILSLGKTTEKEVTESKPKNMDILTCMLPIYKHISKQIIPIYNLMQYDCVQLIILSVVLSSLFNTSLVWLLKKDISEDTYDDNDDDDGV